jgi:hypothetical protein
LFRLFALLTCLLALPLSPAVAAAPTSWRVVMIAGDSSAPVFDNAVTRLGELLAGRKGIELRPLTSDGIYSSEERPLATAQSIDAALSNNLAQGCLVFMTSHGTVDGLYLRHDIDNDRMLSPGRLDRILDKRCGDRPTVIIASACHSGVFIAKATKGDNRIILTAARDDRVSFGCGADFELTYFDECLLKAWPKGGTWQQLFDRTTTCVRLKESELSEAPSMPQAFFGKNVKNLKLP